MVAPLRHFLIIKWLIFLGKVELIHGDNLSLNVEIFATLILPEGIWKGMPEKYGENVREQLFHLKYLRLLFIEILKKKIKTLVKESVGISLTNPI